MSAPRWLRLESDPEVFTKFLHNLGVGQEYAVLDVLGFEPDVLSLVPKSTVGFIFISPEAGPGEELSSPPEGLYWMKQMVGDACGTVAVIHAVVNSGIALEPGSILEKFVNKTRNMSPEEKGIALGEDTEFAAAHEAAAKDGNTAVTGPSYDRMHGHYMAFVHNQGRLYEMTGSRIIDHGPTSPETFLVDAGKACQAKIDSIKATNDSLEFGTVAISKIK